MLNNSCIFIAFGAMDQTLAACIWVYAYVQVFDSCSLNIPSANEFGGWGWGGGGGGILVALCPSDRPSGCRTKRAWPPLDVRYTCMWFVLKHWVFTGLISFWHSNTP